MRRRALAPAVAAIALLVSATPALGLLVWTLVGGPLTATAGTATTFTLTATNLDVLSELGCLEVDLPPSFTIVGAQAGIASNGDDWEAVVFDGKVAVHSLSGGGRLEVSQSVTFTITAVPTAAGTHSWPNHAHQREDCNEAEEAGVALGVTVLPPPLSTPHLTPLPTPTLAPVTTPKPAVQATPTPAPRSTPLATPAATPTADEDAAPASSPSPSRTASPSALPTALPTNGAGGQPPPTASPSGSPDPDRPRFVAVAQPDDSNGAALVSLGALGVIDGLGVWVIPGAVVGGPGLLVILWVAIQGGVAVAWTPAVRRLRGSDSGSPTWPGGNAA